MRTPHIVHAIDIWTKYVYITNGTSFVGTHDHICYQICTYNNSNFHSYYIAIFPWFPIIPIGYKPLKNVIESLKAITNLR